MQNAPGEKSCPKFLFRPKCPTQFSIRANIGVENVKQYFMKKFSVDQIVDSAKMFAALVSGAQSRF